MKPRSFDYVRPRSLDAAIALLAEHGENATILAGGQSLMVALNMRLSTAHLLVDINHIEELVGITLDAHVLRIGAITRHADVERSQTVAQCAPLIALAMPHIAHAAIRNRGTLGGSLCFADPAAELPACVVALGARLVVQSTRGFRTIDAANFFEGLYRTALAADEILVACEIPIASPQTRFGFAELARRLGDFATIGIAAQAAVQNGVFHAARLVYFAAGDRPVIGRAAAAALEGQPNSPQTRQHATQALCRDLDPPSDVTADSSTRLHLAQVLTRRILETL